MNPSRLVRCLVWCVAKQLRLITWLRRHEKPPALVRAKQELAALDAIAKQSPDAPKGSWEWHQRRKAFDAKVQEFIKDRTGGTA